MIPRNPPLPYVTGQRIQLAPHTNSWMRGDRFGEVVRVGRKLVTVRLDRSGRYAKIHPSHIGEVL